MDIKDILSKLKRVEQRGDRWQACCPAHDDNNPSLTIGLDGDTVLLYCHTGCTFEEIVKALNLPPTNNGSKPVTKNKKKTVPNKIVATYDYTDEKGNLLFQKVRFQPKSFSIRHKNRTGWTWGMGNAEPVLYRLPELNKTGSYDQVWIVEGEKDADQLVSLGLVATTNFDGANKGGYRSKWRPEQYNSYFNRRVVYILPDNDNPGRAHAESIAESLYGVAQSVKVVNLPELEDGGDVSDWLLLGHNATDLADICLHTPAWKPAKFQPGDLVDVVIKEQQENQEPCKVLDVFPSHNGERGYLVDLDGEEKAFAEGNLVPSKALPKIWEIRTLKDAYKPRSPVEYVVDGIIALPSLNITFGAPGSLKSMLIGDMCVCIASGEEWLPKLLGSGKIGSGKKTIQCPVLWVDLDNGRRRTDERFDALAKARGLPDTTPLHYVSMPNPPLDITKPDTVNILQTYIEHLAAKVVVIDNLGLVSGDTDENSAAMVLVMGALRRIAEETGTAIIVIHHQRKTYGGTQSRAGDSLRGHSSIEAAIDLALLVMREPGDVPRVIVKSTKDRSVPVPQFGAEFTYTHAPSTKDLASARFFDSEILSEFQAITVRAIDLVIKAAHPLGKEETINGIKESYPDLGINKIRSYLNEMIARGDLIEAPGPGAMKILKVNNGPF